MCAPLGQESAWHFYPKQKFLALLGIATELFNQDETSFVTDVSRVFVTAKISWFAVSFFMSKLNVEWDYTAKKLSFILILFDYNYI